MAILTPSQLTSASNATYFDNVSGSITPTSVRSLNDNWISSSILTSQTSSLTVLSSSYAATASVVTGTVVSASYALSSSYALNATTANSATTAQTASYVLNAVSASRATSALNADTASFVTTAQTASYVLNAVSASRATSAANADNATSSSYALSSSFALTASFALNAGTSINTGSFATTGSNQFNGNQSITGSVRVTGSLTMLGLSPISVSHVKANDVQGVEILTNTNTTVATFGAGGGTGVTVVGQVNAASFAGSGSGIIGVINAQTASLALNAVSASQAANATLFNSLSSSQFPQLVTNNTFTGTQFISNTSNPTSFTTTASFYTDGGARITKDLYVSGTTYLTNLTVFGSASVQYVTTSVLVGLEFIDLNTTLPLLRYAGLNIGDSGSAAGISSSFWYDSEKDNWLFIYAPAGSTVQTSSLAINGPIGYNNVGNEQGLTANYITKGQLVTTENNHHITSSQIFDDGTTVAIAGNLQVTGSLFAGSLTGSLFGTASYALNADTASSVTPLNQSVLITGSLNVTGSTLLNGSTIFKPQYFTTEQPFTINQVSDGTSAGANIIAVRNTSTAATGSFTVSGSSNILLFGAGVTNSSIVNGSLFGFSGRGNTVTNVGISQTGSNTVRTLPTMNNTVLSSTVTVTDNRTGETASPLNLNVSNIGSTFSYTTSTGSMSLNNLFNIGSTTITITGSGAINKLLTGAIFNGAGNVFTIDSPTTANVGNGVLVNGNTNSLLSSGSNYNFASTNILGAGLSLTGSGTTGGSVFAGRFNAQDSSAILANTIFGIGTGTAAGSRRTSFFVSSSGLTVVRNSLEITGSVNGFVTSASIASNTSSLDFSQGNFYTSLVTGTTNFNITNPEPGQTVNLLLTTAGTGASASFSSNVKQVSGSAYAPTATAGAQDILTFISFDGSSVYLASVKNLI